MPMDGSAGGPGRRTHTSAQRPTRNDGIHSALREVGNAGHTSVMSDLYWGRSGWVRLPYITLSTEQEHAPEK
jgi:hypothetical protein